MRKRPRRSIGFRSSIRRIRYFWKSRGATSSSADAVSSSQMSFPLRAVRRDAFDKVGYRGMEGCILLRAVTDECLLGEIGVNGAKLGADAKVAAAAPAGEADRSSCQSFVLTVKGKRRCDSNFVE